MKINPYSGTGITVARETRSRTFICACKARELNQKLDWLEALNGNKTIKEMVN
jgi:hypothetical protein